MEISKDEKKELTFMVYKAMDGKNIPEILKRLNRYGLELSEKTLHRWKQEGRWRELIKEKPSSDFNKEMMDRLLRLIERLERQIEESPRIDAQDAYAYINMIRTAVGLSEKVPERLDPERIKRVAEEILEQEYGIKRG